MQSGSSRCCDFIIYHVCLECSGIVGVGEWHAMWRATGWLLLTAWQHVNTALEGTPHYATYCWQQAQQIGMWHSLQQWHCRCTSLRVWHYQWHPPEAHCPALALCHWDSSSQGKSIGSLENQRTAPPPPGTPGPHWCPAPQLYQGRHQWWLWGGRNRQCMCNSGRTED